MLKWNTQINTRHSSYGVWIEKFQLVDNLISAYSETICFVKYQIHLSVLSRLHIPQFAGSHCIFIFLYSSTFVLTKQYKEYLDI